LYTGVGIHINILVCLFTLFGSNYRYLITHCLVYEVHRYL
jgi:hypothetical protein